MSGVIANLYDGIIHGVIFHDATKNERFRVKKEKLVELGIITRELADRIPGAWVGPEHSLCKHGGAPSMWCISENCAYTRDDDDDKQMDFEGSLSFKDFPASLRGCFKCKNLRTNGALISALAELSAKNSARSGEWFEGAGISLNPTARPSSDYDSAQRNLTVQKNGLANHRIRNSATKRIARFGDADARWQWLCRESEKGESVVWFDSKP